MKKKIIIISSIVVGILGVLITLCFTLFAVNIVEFQSHNQNNYDVSTIQVKKGGSVFFLDKQSIVEDIQLQHPTLNIINIETVFPNKIVVHYAQREDLYAVFDSQNECYYYLDENLVATKRLNKTSYESSQSNPILLSGVTIAQQVVLGKQITFDDNCQNTLKDIAQYMLLCNRDVTEQCALLKDISFVYDSAQKILTDDGYIIKIHTFDDFEILLYTPSKNLQQKVQLLFASLPVCIPDYLETHYLEILDDSENKVFCKISIKN